MEYVTMLPPPTKPSPFGGDMLIGETVVNKHVTSLKHATVNVLPHLHNVYVN